MMDAYCRQQIRLKASSFLGGTIAATCSRSNARIDLLEPSLDSTALEWPDRAWSI